MACRLELVLREHDRFVVAAEAIERLRPECPPRRPGRIDETPQVVPVRIHRRDGLLRPVLGEQELDLAAAAVMVTVRSRDRVPAEGQRLPGPGQVTALDEQEREYARDER